VTTIITILLPIIIPFEEEGTIYFETAATTPMRPTTFLEEEDVVQFRALSLLHLPVVHHHPIS